jgi:2-amino-4-hydroxy-6-hydroxymethyldihydropteridine diphosphokinase
MKSILLLGSNLENPIQQLELAKTKLKDFFGELKESSIYMTAAWGNTNQSDFYNQAIELETNMAPNLFMKKLIDIEESMGRTRLNKWEPRIIDIDIIAMESAIIKEENLEVPHPHMQNRMFVLIPMLELSPEWIHPEFQKSISTLISECKDELAVTKI